jgi:hypothetical protein
MKSFPGFLSRLMLFSAVIAVIHALVATSLPASFRFEPFLILLLFFLLATVVFHFGLLRASLRSDQAFIRYFMGATGVKLFLYMGIMIVFATMFRDQAVGFISNFFVLYLLYSAFEVALVYGKFSSMKSR